METVLSQAELYFSSAERDRPADRCLSRVRRTHLEQDASHADVHDDADLEEPEADRIDLGLCSLGTFES